MRFRLPEFRRNKPKRGRPLSDGNDRPLSNAERQKRFRAKRRNQNISVTALETQVLPVSTEGNTNQETRQNFVRPAVAVISEETSIEQIFAPQERQITSDDTCKSCGGRLFLSAMGSRCMKCRDVIERPHE
jgi:hypothetical protein